MKVHLSDFGADVVQRSIEAIVRAKRHNSISIDGEGLDDEEREAIERVEDLNTTFSALLENGGEVDAEDLETVQEVLEATGSLVDAGTIPAAFVRVEPEQARVFIAQLLEDCRDETAA
jgi:hypothetical protein